MLFQCLFWLVWDVFLGNVYFSQIVTPFLFIMRIFKNGDLSNSGKFVSKRSFRAPRCDGHQSIHPPIHSSESEIKDDEVVVVFLENSVGIEDNSGETPLSDEECESSSESDVDRHEYVREKRQDRS